MGPRRLVGQRTSVDRVHAPVLRAAALLVAAVAAVAWAGSSLSAMAAPAAAVVCSSTVHGDVNGDGHAELAVGEPGNQAGTGSVHLLYGTSRGLVTDASGDARNDQYLSQDSPGVPGGDEKGDAFGESVLLADFNDDGCADLVVAAPEEDKLTGSLTVLYGSRSGLTTDGAQRITPPGFVEPLQLFGFDLTAADLDGDGVNDLVATARNLHTGHGKVVVLYGDPEGLDRGPTRPSVFQGDSAGVGVEPIGFASGVAAGDFDGDGSAELAVGQSALDDEGQVAVLRLGETGFARTGTLTLRSSGVPGTSQRYSGFGAQLAAGDTDGDGRDELAAGVFEPLCGEDCDDDPSRSFSADGAVAVFRGSASGLSGRGAQLWTQDSPGVAGTSKGDAFGFSLAFGRLDTGPTDDLLVGVPFDEVDGRVDAGSVTVLLGGSDGLTTAGAGGTRFSQATPGVAGAPERGDAFGSTVTTVSLSRTGPGAAVLGVPTESLGRVAGAGQVHQLAPAAAGPVAHGSRTFSADTAGLQGRAQSGALFGRALG